MEGAEENLLDFAIHLTDVPRIDIPGSLEFCERYDCLRHRRMPSRRADVAERFLQNTAGSPNIADVADGNDVVGLINAAHDCPFNTLKRQAEVRHLRYKVIAFDASQIYKRNL